MSKGCYLTTTELSRLNNAVRPLRKLTGSEIGGIYLVGSAGERPDFRDVDVRLILHDEQFDALFGDSPDLWAAFSYAWSRTLAADTDLPIDFQVQRQTEANANFDGSRNPLGVKARDFAGLGDATPYNVHPVAAGLVGEPAAPQATLDGVGVGEAAEILGVSKQRTHQLTHTDGFPEPVLRLRATPVWQRSDIEEFARTRSTRPGPVPRDSLAAEVGEPEQPSPTTTLMQRILDNNPSDLTRRAVEKVLAEDAAAVACKHCGHHSHVGQLCLDANPARPGDCDCPGPAAETPDEQR